MNPKIDVKDPKRPIMADSAGSSSGTERAYYPRGQSSLVSAGRLNKKAFTKKASLLGAVGSA